MENSQTIKIKAITANTLIVGVDIAKNIQWAQFTDYRGIEISKHLKFNNDMSGFKSIIEKIEEIKSKNNFLEVMIGMEPTGHYWKPLATFLESNGLTVVLINPFHTKRSKELDDNCQTKSDKKDALTIAKLVKDGRYSTMYLPKNEYSELRALSLTRIEVVKTNNCCLNRIRALMDEYFPEYETVFKTFIAGKTAFHVIKNAPFPSDILKLGEEGLSNVIKEAVKKSVGIKKIKQLISVATTSVGINTGLEGVRLRLQILLENYEQNLKHLELIEDKMSEQLEITGYKEQLLSMPAVGVISAASFLGEIGDPTRFTNAQQIIRLAGYNLVENSSGKQKGKTKISKRGRKNLRALLYKMALVAVAKNNEMKKLYGYLKARNNNPLKKKQALIVISEKIVKVMFGLMKNKVNYEATEVLGKYREEQIAA